MANKLLKPKRGRVENLPKLAVDDGSLIFAYDIKSPTSTVLVDVGETRYELSAATAKKADDSNALGGSSLQNIVDKIDNATGDGTAFIGLDTITNNKVKLTRANGTTVEKTVNNVSNASTADYAKVSNKIGTGTVGSSIKPVYINAGTPTAINSIPSTFVTAQQINGVNLDTLRTPGRYFANGSNTNTGKPIGVDAFALEILQSAGGWYTQICYASNNQEKQFVRYYNSGTSSWSDWIEQNRLNTKTQSGYAPAPNAANKVYRTDASGNPGWGTLNDSSISKLASTVTFGDGNGMRIEQNGNNWRQRINIFDSSQTTQSYSYQQSIDAGKTYKDLFVIGNDGTVVASTFQGALKGTADYSKNSGALGGSSLQNIVDKINNSTGDGTAFTGLDITTNNKVKLTRANGGTVEKTINNVSNASTAEYAKNASSGTAYYLKNNPSSRSTTANLAINGLGGLRTFKATSIMTQGKPAWDSHILHFDWDNTGGWDVQLALKAASDIHAQIRGMNHGAWGNWITLLDESNYTNYAAKKNAYNSASIADATIKLGRSDSSTGTTLTVNNVAHATNADLAKNSNALGGSSLKNITDKIDLSIAANDAMHYMGTLGAIAQKPTITALPTTARIGDAYKVITAGTYSSIAAEVGDLFIYSGSWTLIPSGDDGNVYVGDSKSSKFAAKSNNIVVAVGDQKVASAENITANAGTISALQSTMTQLKANQGTVTTLRGTAASFDTFNGYLNGSALNAKILAQHQYDNQMYVTNDTHILELGYLKCNGSFQNLTLYITSAFWGNQHGSADFINIQQDTNTNSSATVQSYVHAIRIGGSHDRVFYAVKDQTNKRLYIYVKVEGGNSYGKWNISVVQCSSGYNAWVSEIAANVPLPSGNEVISKIYPGTANNSNALGGSSLKNIIDVINNSSADASTKYLPFSGGTMTGTAMIQWPDSGNWSNNNQNVTFPVKRGGLQWAGQSDGIQFYAEETANDNLELVLKFTDDNSNGLSIRNATGTQTARIAATGDISGASMTASGDLTGNQLSLTGSGVQLHREKGIGNGRIKWWRTYGTWTDYMSNTDNGSAPTGGKPSSFGDVTSWAKRSIIENISGYGWIWESSAETTSAASTLSPTPIMSLSSNNGNLKVKGTVTATTVNAYLNGNAKNADTVDGFHAIDSNNLTASATSAKIILAKNVVSYIGSLGLATTSQLEWIEF